MRLIVTSVLLTALAGCASSSPVASLVKANNWAGLGAADVEKGYLKKDQSELNRISSKYSGNNVDYQAYSNAYDAGLPAYCDLDNAYVIGFAGLKYYGICDHLPHGKQFRNKYNQANSIGKDDL